MEIQAHLTEVEAQKLSFIQEKTQQDLIEILKKAIDLYYKTLQIPQKTPLQILEESGFIGCCSVESDLSTTYKSVLTEKLNKKYDYC
jgi:predicted metal-dependent hydrolase